MFIASVLVQFKYKERARMKKFLSIIVLAAVCCGCSSVQQGKVTEVSKWTLTNVNGCWSLSSNDKCCSKMVKVLNPEDCKCKNFKEEAACVTFPADLKKVNGTEYYRVEMTEKSGDTKIYWHNTKQVAKQ